MKAILVIEMPSSCIDCPFSSFILGQAQWECEANKMELSDIDLDIERPDYCPLREVPQKDGSVFCNDEFDEGWVQGYNACIDELLGGAEE